MEDSIKKIKAQIFSSEKFSLLKNLFKENSNSIVLNGVNGSLASFIVDYIYKNVNKKIVYISHDNDRIVKTKDDLGPDRFM